MRGRGLKQNWCYGEIRKNKVAPHAGAWIETMYENAMDLEEESPLMRGRGLKQLVFGDIPPAYHVAPHAGAWIETTPGQ